MSTLKHTIETTIPVSAVKITLQTLSELISNDFLKPEYVVAAIVRREARQQLTFLPLFSDR